MKKPLAAAVGALLTLLIVAGASLATTAFVWSDLLDGNGSQADYGHVAIVDEEGNLIVGGETIERVGGSAFFVRKQDRLTGNEIWSRRVPSYDGSDMAVTQVALDSSNDVMVSGYIAGCGT